jgi:hypothetical protein
VDKNMEPSSPMETTWLFCAKTPETAPAKPSPSAIKKTRNFIMICSLKTKTIFGRVGIGSIRGQKIQQYPSSAGVNFSVSKPSVS